MRKTALYRDSLFLDHKPGYDHPESPDRLQVVFDELDRFDLSRQIIYPPCNPASEDIITLNHNKTLYKRVAQTAGLAHDFLDVDTRTSENSFAAACLAVGSLIDGIERLDRGEIANAFCLVRPPGHHAEADHSMGFCLFNNVAIAARYAMKGMGYKRVMILDWDLHHGNGTQHSFYDTDKVLYCSMHQYPYFPGSGALLETGQGKGEGFTVNVPLSGGHGDEEYARICNELFVPVARIYQPDLILISCGFDIYDGDPLGAMRVTPAGFAYMTRVMRDLSEELCAGKMLVTLEGGYSLAGMRDGSMAVLSELCHDAGSDTLPRWLGNKKAARLRDADCDLPVLEQAKSIQKKYWQI